MACLDEPAGTLMSTALVMRLFSGLTGDFKWKDILGPTVPVEVLADQGYLSDD